MIEELAGRFPVTNIPIIKMDTFCHRAENPEIKDTILGLKPTIVHIDDLKYYGE